LKFLENSLIEHNLKKITETTLDRVIRDLEVPLEEIIITEENKIRSKLKKSTILSIFLPEEHKLCNNTKLKENKRDDILSDDSDSDETLYNLNFYVIGFEPREPKEFVQGY